MIYVLLTWKYKMPKTPPRTRLTIDSLATIQKATIAKVTKTEEGRFEVTVFKDDKYEASHVLQSGGGNALYPTVTAAKQAVRRHNAMISFPRAQGTPAPGFE
jgi:hypothetical protein